MPQKRDFLCKGIVLSFLLLPLSAHPSAFLKKLKSKILETTWEQRLKNYQNLTTPGYGLYVIPRIVEKAVLVLRKHQLTDYRYSQSWSDDILYRQRLHEAAWPIKLDSSSEHTISLGRKGLRKNCTVVEGHVFDRVDPKGKEELIYAICPR
ncbi:MAG: hypothetical protein HOE90_00695 [Bacteriovoracaceae bacterium]|jgi:hypothetical protein|nr:hypothetical protein [Bacteriovoracaceae bacterium]